MSNPAPEEHRPGGRRRRPPPRPVEVVSVESMTPRLVSIRFGGPSLEGFQIEEPTSHIKVFLPGPGETEPALPTPGADGVPRPDGPRPLMRTYTPRRYDEASGTLEVQFVVHGAGPASEWASQAKPGDRVAVAGPGGRFRFDPSVKRWWIGGDESALPAIGTLLDALSAEATAEVHLEVADDDDHIPMSSPAQATVTWHHRGETDGWGDELHDAARAASLDDDTRVWVAGEAAAIRRIRRELVDAGVSAGAMVTRGYWRLGEADHPDGDYGDDG